MAEPVISYPGAKWRFYPHMVEYFPTDMKTFIEPFFGGGSVSLSVADDPRFTKLERMIGGDLYTETWALWNGIKKDPSAVVEIATKWITEACPHQNDIRVSGFVAGEARKYLPGGELDNFETNDMFDTEQVANIKDKIKLYNTAIEEAEKFWKWAEEVDCTTMSLEERAARMILVNKISFSGMGDSGSLSKDQFCNFRLDKLDTVYQASKLLQKIEILNVSFEETMKFAEDDPNNSFIFLDPPYAKQETSGLYGRGGNTHKGFPHEHFAEFTKGMHSKWFMTYDDSVIVRKLFSGKTVDGKDIYILPFTIPGGYTMAGKTAEDALAGEEVFIANYNIVDGDEVSEDDYDF